MSKLHLILALVVVCGGACGGDDPSAPSGETQAPCPAGFLPLRTGTVWKYFVRDLSSTLTSMKETTVGALEAVPKVPSSMAYKIVTKKGVSLRDETVSWQNRVGTQVVRYQETTYKPGAVGAPLTEDVIEWWSPHKLRLDESADKLRKGMSWQLQYTESSLALGTMTTRMRSETWTVVGVNEEVTVPKGTYSALHVHRAGAPSTASDPDGSSKDYWFACGVGKVKETGGQTEELTDFTIAP